MPLHRDERSEPSTRLQHHDLEDDVHQDARECAGQNRVQLLADARRGRIHHQKTGHPADHMRGHAAGKARCHCAGHGIRCNRLHLGSWRLFFTPDPGQAIMK